MKSKTSFFNKTIYQKNLTRFWAFSLFYFAFLFVSMSCKMILHHLEMQKHPDTYTQALRNHQDLFDSITKGNVPLFVAIYMILVTLAVFSYLYQRRSCNMMHTFPVNRKILFTTGIASVLTLTLLPQLAVTLINTIIFLAFGAGNIVWIPWYWMLCMIGYDLCFLGIALFTAMISGQLITNFIFYWIFNFVFMAAELVIRMVLAFLCFGLYTSDVYQGKLLFLTPIAYLPGHTGLYTDETGTSIYHILPEALPVLLAYALAGIVLGVIAYALYKRKALETSGDFITVSFMKPAFILGITFFVSLLATVGIGNALSNLLSENETVFFLTILFLSLLVGIVLCFIIQMLVARSIHVWRASSFKYCGIYTGILLLFLLCVRFDLCGAETKLPVSSNVLEADISFGDANYALTDTKEIEEILSLHREIIQDKEELVDYSRHCSEPYAFFDITYHLKDGSNLTRSYHLPDVTGKSQSYQNICQEILAFLNGKDTMLTHSIAKNYADLSAEDANFHTASETDDIADAEKSYTNEQLRALYQAFLQDVEDGNYKIAYLDSNALCYADTIDLSLRSPEPIILDSTKQAYYNSGYVNIFSEYYVITRSRFTKSDSSVADESKAAIATYGDTSVRLYVHPTPSCTHTLQAMIDMGMIASTDDLTLSTAGEVYMFTDE